jgi:Cys-rich protein (TIGR01571 family)
MGLMPGLLNCLAHGGLRAEYGIPGSIFEDILAGCCCAHCSICQQVRCSISAERGRRRIIAACKML